MEKIGAWRLLRQAWSEWSADEAPRRAAALAFYTVFALAPLALLLLTLAGFIFGDDAARSLVDGRLRDALGDDKAETLLQMTRSRGQLPRSGGGATILGALTLLVGASGVVGELQASLVKMWDLPRGAGLRGHIVGRLLSVLFIMGVGVLVLGSMIVSAGVSAAGKYLNEIQPVPEALLQTVNSLASFSLIAVLFALVFKYIPRAKVPWRDAWVGGAVTAALMVVGNLLLGLYLGKRGPASVYGAAGSVLALLLWTYYCAQILYFGAEFTQVYARHRGWRPTPSPVKPN